MAEKALSVKIMKYGDSCFYEFLMWRAEVFIIVKNDFIRRLIIKILFVKGEFLISFIKLWSSKTV